MKKKYFPILCTFLGVGSVCLLLIPWLVQHPASVNVPTEHVITQIATIDSLLAGVYDGETTLDELSRYGNFGIGTFDKLDGEMVVLDGVFYQIKSDGGVYLPNMNMMTPFASVVSFGINGTTKRNVSIPLDNASLHRMIDEMISNKNIPVAIRLKGRFSLVRTRSVPPQQKPYKPLVEVTKTQPEFDLGTLDGDVVGFRLPEYVRGINVSGYHLHFLSADRKSGGHVLHLTMDSGTVELDPVHRFEVILPKTISMFIDADLSKDRSDELEKVEK
jgi:acetolactate decarboxylase